MSQDFECVVSADLFRRAMIGVSKEGSRYYLNGVHISPNPEGGAILVATDGHILIAMVDRSAIVSGEGIVSLDAAMTRALPAGRGRLLNERLLFISFSGGAKSRAFIIDAPKSSTANAETAPSPYDLAKDIAADPDENVKAAQLGTVVIDGHFPDWRKVVPSNLKPGGAVPTFNHNLLVRAASALAAGRVGSYVRITPSATEDGPLLVTCDESGYGPEGFAIIMPVWSPRSGRPAAIPTWAQAAKLAEAA